MVDYLIIGRIVNVHGIKGALKVMPDTDDPQRYKKLKKVIVSRNNTDTEYEIQGVAFQQKFVLLALKGLSDRTEAEKFKGAEIKIPREEGVKLPEGSYYIADLLECTVVEENGNVLGKVDDVFPAGGSDVYSVTDDKGKNILIPAIADVVKNVDIEKNVITVKLLPGLVD